MRLLLAPILCSILAACSSVATPADPAQAVYQAETNYTAALTVAVAYKNLPACPAATVVGTARTYVCSDPAVVAKLQRADDIAYAALTGAQNTVRSPGAGANAATAVIAAQQAVAALTAITTTLQIK